MPSGRNTLHRALSGLISSRKGASSDSKNNSDDEAPQPQSISQLLSSDDGWWMDGRRNEEGSESSDRAVNPSIHRESSLHNELKSNSTGSHWTTDPETWLQSFLARNAALPDETHIQILIISTPKPEIKEANVKSSESSSDNSSLTINLANLKSLLAGAESRHKLRETTNELHEKRVELDRVLAERERLRELVALVNGEVKSVHSVLDEMKAQFGKFMKERFALSQHVHRLDEEKKKLQDQLSNIQRDHKTFHDDAMSKVQEELQNVRLVLDSTQSELQESHSHAFLLAREATQYQRVSKDIDLALENADAEIKLLTKEKAKSDDWREKFLLLADALQSGRAKQKICEEKIVALEAALASKSSAHLGLHLEFGSLNKEKEKWQGRTETLLHKVTAAERRVRMLNHLAARNLEHDMHREEHGQFSIRRGNNTKPQDPSQEIVQAVVRLNETIAAVASELTPFLLTSVIPKKWSVNMNRLKMVLGDWATSTALARGCNRPWFLTSVIQMFLVDWCRSIIEAWYPKQKFFSEMLMLELASQKNGTSTSQSMPDCRFLSCAKQFQLIQMATGGSESPDLQSWAEDILDDLLGILPAPEQGLKLYQREEIVLPKLLELTRLSYDLRLALAEEDVCGNLQLFVYPSGIQFQREKMNITNLSKSNLGTSSAEQSGDISGTVGIGLRRITIQKSSKGVSTLGFGTLLAPNIILASELQTE